MGPIVPAILNICFGLAWLGTVAYLLLKKKKNFVYVLFFTVFAVYLYKVLDYTLFQFQSLLLMKYFMPELMLRGQEAGQHMNLIPLLTLTLDDLKTSLLNILLFMPFGFGLPFITAVRMKKVVIAATLTSIGIELLQLTTGLLAGMTFRIADVNDVLFNMLGAAIGYVVFAGFARVCRDVFSDWKISANPLMRYILERPQLRGSSDRL